MKTIYIQTNGSPNLLSSDHLEVSVSMSSSQQQIALKKSSLKIRAAKSGQTETQQIRCSQQFDRRIVSRWDERYGERKRGKERGGERGEGGSQFRWKRTTYYIHNLTDTKKEKKDRWKRLTYKPTDSKTETLQQGTHGKQLQMGEIG